MKKLLLALPFLFASCGEYKAMLNEKMNFKADSIAYFTDDKMSLLPVKINNVTHNFIYDTGAGTTILNYPKFTLNGNAIRKRKIKGFDNKTTSAMHGYLVDSLTTPLFSIKDKYLYYSPLKPSSCGVQPAFDGVLERHFAPEGYMTELNYEKGFVRFVKSADLAGYNSLDVKFALADGTFYIKLEVNGVSDFFLFDTGNKNITTLSQKFFKSMPESIYAINIIGAGVNNVPIPMNVQIYNADFKMGGLTFNYPVGIDNGLDRNILNLNFIQQFNWLIDQKNKVVYYKPKNIQKLIGNKEINAPEKMILSNVFGQKLLIYYLNFSHEKFNVGDEIVAVNNQTVSPENICEIGKLLNTTKDWSTLEIKTVRASK